MNILKNIPLHCKVLIYRLGLVLLLLSIIRILFYYFNSGSFTQASIGDFFIGSWFDLITVSLFFFPFIVFSLVPFYGKSLVMKDRIMNLYFHIASILIYAVNLMDIEYFKYTTKRSTFDLFTILGAGSDFKQLVMSFITDFWVLLMLLFFILILHFKLFKSTRKLLAKHPFDASKWKTSLVYLFLLTPLFVIFGRGGLQLKPVGIIEAAQYTRAENSALILNTGFTMIKSYGKERLEFKTYFTEKEELKLFNPVQISQPQHILPDGTNVVIIILESFGNEFVGQFNGGDTYTPFLDSIIQKSLTFDYSFANGKKSIEAVPAILGSIPSLMDNPYISSPYGNNKIESLATILGKNGYSSGFYHGATNGSMRFDGFAAQAGFQHYFGRYEYNNDEHFDKTWGILDEYFNPWSAKQMSKLKEPFFGTLFTLSSHHPYFIPEKWQNKVKKGKQLIAGSINYGDISLRKFFEEAKKQPWYENTLFVLCADHTPASTNAFYNQRSMMYRVPIIFYHPKQLLHAKRENTIFQQLDILPTVLDLLNIKTKYYSYGQSYYKKADREAITYLEGTHYYFKDNYMLTFSNEKARNLYSFKVHQVSPVDSISLKKGKVQQYEKRLKAIIQRYNRDLMKNKTTAL
ncbi:MAG: LTA synthase family protein [Crocinitomicaceae bacterium]|nr:LTA synthase family protein [Crocinitomicaceae bacterium]MDP5011467.1 LTA synthase family protein [Crocinitomicaceae bacterium]